MTEQATLPPPTDITGPGVYSIPSEQYHARTELSSTGARKLLPPSCPAMFRHWRENGQAPKHEFDFGSAAHRVVLGVGEEIAEIKADNWRSSKDRDLADGHRAAGRIPLLSKDLAVVHEMAERLREHPIASALFRPGTGQPEQALIWEMAGITEGGDVRPVWCRALVDWLPNPVPGRRLVLPDLKTCASAAPADLEKAMARYGYYTQMSFYLAGLRALGLAGPDAEAVLVCQEKTPPYLVTVMQPDSAAMALGAKRVRDAVDVYANCVATDRWPGYSDDVVLGSLPPWETRELDGQVW